MTDDALAIYAFPRNLVLAASAGTGKTHALVGVAVHLLMGGCLSADGGLRPPIAPESLVGTTFSRKAAGEIRVRLRIELESLASGDPRAQYRESLDAVCAQAGVAPWSEAELATRAGHAAARLSRAKLGTLHSFATRLVRTYALAVGISPDFGLTDEEEARERVAAAIERILDASTGDDDVRSLVRLAGGGEAFVALTTRLLTRVADDGRRAKGLRLATDDVARIEEKFRELIGHASALTDDAKLGEVAKNVLRAQDARDLVGLETAVAEMFGVSKAGKKQPFAEAFFTYRDEVKEASGSPNLRDAGGALVRRYLARGHVLPRARAMKGLLERVEAEIHADNQRDSMLTFAQVLRAARDLLRDHPDVAREVRGELSALLVDESQDTSGVQRDLILLLWERDGDPLREPGVVPGAGDLRREGLFIVGDRKQSIYAFRGADAAVFAELAVGLAGRRAREALAVPEGTVWEPSEPSADFVALRHNRRGKAELLAFANAASRLSLVPEGSPAELYEVDYVATTEDLVSPAPPPESPVARTRWLRVAAPGGKKKPSVLDEASVIASRIAEIVDGGTPVGRNVPARYRDIAVLAERHHMLAAVAHALGKADIPYVAAGMGFYAAREVRDVIAMLGCLADPADSLSRAEVLRGPWAGVSDRTLVALTDLHQGLADVESWTVGERRRLIDPDDAPALAELSAVIVALRPLVGRAPPGEILRHAVRALRLEEVAMLLPAGAQRVANIEKVLAMADGAADAQVLLRRLRQAALAEEREGDAPLFSDEDDAVRLLTMHASKGLAFPIVFLPEVGAEPRRRDPYPVVVHQTKRQGESTLVLRLMDHHGGVHDTPSYARAKTDEGRRLAAERRRLRYVAMTRASDAMFYVGDRAVPKGSRATYESTMAGLLARLSDDEASRLAAYLEVEVATPKVR